MEQLQAARAQLVISHALEQDYNQLSERLQQTAAAEDRQRHTIALLEAERDALLDQATGVWNCGW